MTKRDWPSWNQRRNRRFGFFDCYTLRRGVAETREIDVFTPEGHWVWKDMTTPERVRELQKVEDIHARLDGRPAEKVYGEFMEPGTYGYFDERRRSRGIHVNTNSEFFEDPAESLNTVVHEGRHAYQKHAARLASKKRPGYPAPYEEARLWKANRRRYTPLTSPSDEVPYMTQPIERDAGSYGFAFTQGVFPDYKPHPHRINTYNTMNAEADYGRLRLASRKSARSHDLPARVDRRRPNQRQAAERTARRCAAEKNKRARSPKKSTTDRAKTPQRKQPSTWARKVAIWSERRARIRQIRQSEGPKQVHPSLTKKM